MTKVLMVSFCCWLFTITHCWKVEKKNAIPPYQSISVFQQAYQKDGSIIMDLPKEKSARFPGCEYDDLSAKERADCAEREMFRFIYSSFRYPVKGWAKAYSENIITKFIITETRTIQCISIIEGGAPPINKEIIRVLESMPCWIPGEYNKEHIQVEYKIPIKIRFE